MHQVELYSITSVELQKRIGIWDLDYYRWIGIYGCTTAEYHSSMRPEPNDLGTSVRGQVGP